MFVGRLCLQLLRLASFVGTWRPVCNRYPNMVHRLILRAAIACGAAFFRRPFPAHPRMATFRGYRETRELRGSDIRPMDVPVEIPDASGIAIVHPQVKEKNTSSDIKHKQLPSQLRDLTGHRPDLR